MEFRRIEAALLPLYQCHKTVHAGVIEFVSMRMNTEGDRNLGVRVGDSDPMVEGCAAEMFTRYTPKPGDYLVVYDAGERSEYRSISPKAVFEAGYQPIALGLDQDAGAGAPAVAGASDDAGAPPKTDGAAS